MLSNDSKERKNTPFVTGCIDYFALALAAIARHSKWGNDKHNPGQPLHWSREKSSDHADCIGRHLADRGTLDPESGDSHTVGLAWRSLALLQIEEEERIKRESEPLPLTFGSPKEALKSYAEVRRCDDSPTPTGVEKSDARSLHIAIEEYRPIRAGYGSNARISDSPSHADHGERRHGEEGSCIMDTPPEVMDHA